MNTEQIQAEIDKLQEQMKKETIVYKTAVKEGVSFETAKKLLSKTQRTAQKIIDKAKEYDMALAKEIEKIKKN